jgi:uncharacterized protein YyaL (SSP411 family)
MAIGALAAAGARAGRADWIVGARVAADAVLALHLPAGPHGPIARASLHGRHSDALATLEDLGGLAGGLLRLSLALGDAGYASIARSLIERTRAADGGIAAPGGRDPVLVGHGLAAAPDLDDGATPSGAALLADAALLLWTLSGDDSHRRIAEDAIAPALGNALVQPSAFGAALAVASRLVSPVRQLVVVSDDPGEPLSEVARSSGPESTAVVTSAQAEAFAASGFELFVGRAAREGMPVAYFCEQFVCALPVTDGRALVELLAP